MDEQQEKQMALSQPIKAQPVWFFERGNGNIISCEENEAWDILKHRNNWTARDFKLIGHSDGSTYVSVIKNAKNEMFTKQQEKSELEKDLSKYLQTEDDLRFKQLKDDDDEMVKRVVVKRKEMQSKIDDINKELGDFNRNVLKKAFDSELEKARGNIVYPANQDIITPVSSDRNIILNNIRG